jgi:dihydrolipoamide dehydrogenase
MAETTNFDLVVIGGGPGGYVAGIRAAQLGQNVAVVERDNLGGICLNWGCIPTKALLRNADIANLLKQGNEFGFKVDNVTLDYAVAQKRSRQVSDRLVRGVGSLFRKYKVNHVKGTATLLGPTRVQVQPSGEVLEAKNLIIATGARPRSFPNMQIDGKKIITYREALELTTVPSRLVVVGAGAIGMEFAYVFRSYGAEVTVIEMLPHLLPLEDEETAAEVTRAFKKQGIKLFTNTRTEDVQPTDGGVAVRVKDQASGQEQTFEADVVLVAIGVQPNTDGIGLETTGVTTDKRGFIEIDDFMRTNVPHVYAIGDVTGKLPLAHVGMRMGVVAVEHLTGHEARPIRDADYVFMPRCTYCHPQVASLGLTEAQARERGREIKVGKFPFIANGKALGLGERDGFVKIIADAKYGEILGAHLVGAEVTELLPELELARTWELTTDEIARSVHPHPTLSEALMEAAEAVNGQSIHY